MKEYIEKQKILNFCKSVVNKEFVEAFNAFAVYVNTLPTIEVVQGEWTQRNPYWHTAICSNCNKVTMFEEWDEEVIEYDFCPNCGAKMKGADDA